MDWIYEFETVREKLEEAYGGEKPEGFEILETEMTRKDDFKKSKTAKYGRYDFQGSKELDEGLLQSSTYFAKLDFLQPDDCE